MRHKQHHVRPPGLEEPSGEERAEAGEVESPWLGEEDLEEQQLVERREQGSGDEEILERALEDHPVHAAPDPRKPSSAEISRHRLIHLPFRPWCPDCVVGRAPDDPHAASKRDEEDRALPKVSVDYAFMSLNDEEESRTILLLKAQPSKIVAARCTTGKGRADPEAVPWMIEQLRRPGLARCVMQADGEPAQRTFIKDIIEGAGRVGSTGVAQAHSPAYDHRSNSDLGRAIRELKNQVRVFHGALVRNFGAIPSSAPAFDWLVGWAGELISGALVGRDGMIAVRRFRGKD